MVSDGFFCIVFFSGFVFIVLFFVAVSGFFVFVIGVCVFFSILIIINS